MTTSLDLLKQTGTVVVSDSGDFECERALEGKQNEITDVATSDRCLQAAGCDDEPVAHPRRGGKGGLRAPDRRCR